MNRSALTERQNNLLELLLFLILFLVVFVLYMKSIWFEFIPIWDDSDYILSNQYIQGFSFENLKGIFTNTFLGNYAPLHMISYILDYSLWGFDPRGYHLSGIILHWINACLAYLVVKKISDNQLSACIASLLFALHPLNIENVAWVSERKSLLATAFFFVSILFYIRFRARDSRKYYLMAMVSFLFAILSKASTVILPAILAAYEIFICTDRRRWLHLSFFFVLSAAGVYLAVWAQMNDRAIETGFISIEKLFGTVYPTMVVVFWKYIKMIFWPFGLSCFYDTAIYSSFLDPWVIAALSAWVLLFVMVFRRGSVQVRFWFIWFWICLLPVTNIIPIPVYYADRYMYTPAIAVFVLAGFAISKIIANGNKQVIALEGINKSRQFFICLRRPLLYIAISLIILFYGLISYNRLDVWRNELVLWEDAVRKSPRLYKPHLNLGLAYDRRSRYAEAEQEYLAAIAITPDEKALNNLSIVRTKMRLLRELNK